jgi:subtilase family protein
MTFVRAAAVAFASLLAVPAAAAAVDVPMSLPGDATASSAPAARDTWIVGARPGAAGRAVAHRFGARRTGPAGTGGYVLARGRARAFAAALRRQGLLVYAQPDTLAEPLQAGTDPLTAPPDDWRAKVVGAAAFPPVTPTSPLIALVDAQLDTTHPEFVGGNTTALPPALTVNSSHGTATASVAAAPINGRGIEGIWPGARALNVPLPSEEITCSQRADSIDKATEAGAAVINMSYGSLGLCFPEYVALQFAVAQGVVPVAAAGNEFGQGNPLEYPATLPHVLTVAALDNQLASSAFSNTSPAIDLSAPGEDIMVAVPPALDTDAVKDGYERETGTSFSAPMVAAAVAWIRAKRPDLTPDQVAQAVRLSAVNIGRAGWDQATGFGVLNLPRAETFSPPPPDPLEPNDDIIWVDGRAFGKPDVLIYAPPKRKKARLVALLDAYEDPADVYRVRLRPRSKVKVSANPAAGGDVALYAYKRKAKRLSSKPLARSAHKGKRTERLVLRNRSGKKATYYVAVEIQPRSRILDAGYALRVG